MSYYDSIEEDLKRAKEILEKGKAKIDFATDFPFVTQADRESVVATAGGTIFGADIYAAYKLLESFVEEIERLERDQVKPDVGVFCAHCEHVIETCPKCGKVEWRKDFTGSP